MSDREDNDAEYEEAISETGPEDRVDERPALDPSPPPLPSTLKCPVTPGNLKIGPIT